MKNLTKLLLLIVVCVAVIIVLSAKPVFGAVDTATCAISVNVSSFAEWEGANFAAIDLDDDATDGPITAQAHNPVGSSVYTLWLNVEVTLTADNTAAAQLLEDGAGTDILVTKYKISTDEDGTAASGAEAAAVAASGSGGYLTHDLFLDTGLVVTHFANDGATEVTLEVEATNTADDLANAGLYEAVQTITATW